jgi:hypothetical protein
LDLVVGRLGTRFIKPHPELTMSFNFFLPSTMDQYDSLVDDAIATCNGDLRGAVQALIMANEFLEKKLEKARQCLQANGSDRSAGSTTVREEVGESATPPMIR